MSSRKEIHLKKLLCIIVILLLAKYCAEIFTNHFYGTRNYTGLIIAQFKICLNIDDKYYNIPLSTNYNDSIEHIFITNDFQKTLSDFEHTPSQSSHPIIEKRKSQNSYTIYAIIEPLPNP